MMFKKIVKLRFFVYKILNLSNVQLIILLRTYKSLFENEIFLFME